MALLSSLLSTPWQYYVSFLLTSPVALLVVSKLWRRYRAQHACLRHRHFVITGGSSGIGRALARAAVRRGANVTIIARNLDRLEEAKLELLEEASSPEQAVHTLSADLAKGNTSEAVLARGIEEAEQVCGPVDYLVNCAGSAISLRFDETPLIEFRRMMEVNYLSAVHTTMAVLPGMKQRGSGSITFVSSIVGLMGLYGYTAYCPSKFALVGLAQSLRMEASASLCLLGLVCSKGRQWGCSIFRPLTALWQPELTRGSQRFNQLVPVWTGNSVVVTCVENPKLPKDRKIERWDSQQFKRLDYLQLVLSERQPLTQITPVRSDFEVRAWRDLTGKTDHVTRASQSRGCLEENEQLAECLVICLEDSSSDENDHQIYVLILEGFCYIQVKHHGIHVMVAFPPDTDTPGFAEEERTKPTETKLISAMVGLSSADAVATTMLQDILESNTTSALGLDGQVALIMCAGMMPPSSLLEVAMQALTMGALRVVGCLYQLHFYRLIARCAANREDSKKGS
ncbi:hypothetical protein HPB51_022304 [Rhipicephalus microplus]|uniref:Ketoreductase domain-containing protein n=1 Tax=Rhipicephalus microplus TaxID=6941 RepID=A0A9J6DJN0_RHIMP|nr:hypothetical protein HPB51_022304 [Rhipicephalus microplus]